MPESRNVRLVGHSDLDGWGDAFQITVRDGIAYVGHSGDSGNNGTTIVDVADAAKPSVIAQMPAGTGARSHKTQLLDNFLIVNQELFRGYQGDVSAFQPGIRIFDVSEPGKPRDVAFFRTGGQGVHRPIVDEETRRIYLSTRDPDSARGQLLWILDASKPDDPKLLSRWWHAGQEKGAQKEDGGGLGVTLHEARRSGDTLFAGFLDGGLVSLDISDIDHPTEIGRHLVPSEYAPHEHTPWPIPERGLLLVAHETLRPRCEEPPAFLWIYDVSDPARMTPISTYMPYPIDPQTKLPSDPFCYRGGRYGCHNLWHGGGDLVYVVWFNGGLRIVDIADPYRPVERGSYVADAPEGRVASQANDVFVDDRGLIYVSDRWGGGMDILEFVG